MNEAVIRVDGVSKKYCRSLKHTMMYGAVDLGKSFLGLKQQSERLREGEFWAVNDVSFELKRGETLGVIGMNGSGKSTLLKMLNGIIMPDKGSIEVSGRVGALIEVGAGFHPMLTGRENMYINGAILGMNKKEMDEKFDMIIDFAGIRDFIDAPVKHYSSGMYVRLGFAIAVYADPDILLVDEALAVGDVRFQKKCLDRMNAFKESGKTIIMVIHGSIKNIASKGLLLDQGNQIFVGGPIETELRYMQLLYPDVVAAAGKQHTEEIRATNGEADTESGSRYCIEIFPKEHDIDKSFGAGGAWINWIKILGLGKPNIFHGGEKIEIAVSYSWDQAQINNMLQLNDVDCNLLFGIRVETSKGIILTDLATSRIDSREVDVDPLSDATCVLTYTVEFPFLADGDYFLSPGIALGRQEKLVALVGYENLIHIYCHTESKFYYGLMKWNYNISKNKHECRKVGEE